MESTHYYLCNETLEIFIALLFKEEIKIKKFCYRGKSDNYNFYDDLDKYPKYKLNKAIKYLDFLDDEYFIFVLIDEEKLKEFLQYYINLYKKGELESNSNYGNNKTNYYTYDTNLEYMQEVFNQYTKSCRYNIMMNSEYIQGLELKEYPKASNRGRFEEFILDIYLKKDKYEKYLKINGCELRCSKDMLRPFVKTDFLKVTIY